MMENLSDQTLATLEQLLDLQLTPQQIEQFGQFKQLLLEWNERINLTAVRTPQGIEQTHFVDSLSLLLGSGPLVDQALIDVGTGAGFPGIPLKIAYPTLKLTLVESVRKKGTFLHEAVQKLALKNVTIVSERAELLGRDPAHREQYDWAVARAVAELNVLIEYLAPFCRISGRVLAMKGPGYQKEVAAAQSAAEQLNVELTAQHRIPEVLSGDKERYLLLFEKRRETPDRYPRRPGIAIKRPL